MLTDILQALYDLGSSFGDGLMGLALSPFARVEQMTLNSEILSIINWIFPLTECVALLQLWGVSITSWYIFKYLKKHLTDKLNGIVGEGGLFGSKK